MPEIKRRLPKKYNNYYEPFVGSGAVLFDLLPENAIINDLNKELINTYNQIRDNIDLLINFLEKLDNKIYINGDKFYYYTRDKYNEKIKNKEYDTKMAAMFIFLNKHCFNGLYRVNNKGLFNVPYNGNYKASFNENDIRNISNYLKKIIIKNEDFEETCKKANKKDFIFIDSPYAPIKQDIFKSYTKEGFGVENHKRLAKLYDELTARGCYCMLTNHNTELINELYGNKGYKIDVVSAKRMINSDASNRVGEEVIICNY